MSGLDLETEKKIKEVFSSFDEIDKVILYGSRAKGNYKIGSDIDLTLYGKNLKLQIIYKIQEKLDELYLPYKFDLSIYAHLDNLELKESIDNSGVVFYQKKYGLPKGWEIKKLGEVCEIINGKNQSQVISDDGKYPIYGSGGNIMGYANDYICEKGTTIIGRKGNISNPIFINERFWNVDTAFGIYPKNQSDPKFINYLCQTIDFKSRNKGTTIPSLVKSDLLTIEISFPKSLKEQQRIVSILDECFSAITVAKANAQKNLKNAKELFESYLQGVFENKGEDWEVKTLGEIADVEYGYTDKSTEEGDYRYIRITDIDKNGELILDDKKYIKHSKEAEGFLIQDNDLLMARTGATFAKVLLFNGDESSVFASYLIRIKFKEKIENALYWHFTKTKKYWEQANSLQSGAAQPHFNGAAVKQVVFAYPKSVKEQKALIEKFETLSIETKRLEAIYQQKINNLEELKKSILQKAFSGCLLARV